ncbi:MAG: AAA family ATPase, partial [Ilumatobacteraceae bacterium]|nr:AAA family ATPase [Ilumatobacteraceae bacterium]
DASELIEGFQAVTTKRLEFESASSEHVAARYAYRTLIAPIAAEVEVWSPAAVASRCDELVELRNKRAELSANEREARRYVDKAVSQNDQVRELESQGNSKDSLVRQRDELSSQVGLLKKERSGLQEQVGALGERLEGIAQESELARLSAEAGALDEASDDRVIEAAAHSVARRLLSEVAEQQRQANQPALVKRASELLVAVQSEWEHILVSQDGSTAQVSVRGRNGVEVPAHQLSTGARALLYLALRLAMADQDAADRGFRFPIICDDPLIHLDDERSRQVLPLLAEASNNGHQVVLFTCHRRTVEAAKAVGARIVPLDGGIV